MGRRIRTGRSARSEAVRVYEFSAGGSRYRGTADQIQVRLMDRARREGTTVQAICAQILREADVLVDESAQTTSVVTMLRELAATGNAAVYVFGAPRRSPSPAGGGA